MTLRLCDTSYGRVSVGPSLRLLPIVNVWRNEISIIGEREGGREGGRGRGRGRGRALVGGNVKKYSMHCHDFYLVQCLHFSHEGASHAVLLVIVSRLGSSSLPPFLPFFVVSATHHSSLVGRRLSLPPSLPLSLPLDPQRRLLCVRESAMAEAAPSCISCRSDVR